MFNFGIGVGLGSLVYNTVRRLLRAVVSPTAEHLADGALVSSITNFAALTDVQNYSPGADTAEIEVNGVTATGATALSLDDDVVLRVTKTGFPDLTFIIDGRVGVETLFVPSDADRFITSDNLILSHSGA